MKHLLRKYAPAIALGGLFCLLGTVASVPGLQLIGLTVFLGAMVSSIWGFTDPDPVDAGVQVTDDEARIAFARLRWVQATVDELVAKAHGARLRPVRFSNRNAYFSPWTNRIHVSKALCARLCDDDLRLILAHEVGHASRRLKTWCAAWREASRIQEEICADAIALSLIRGTAADWERAVVAARLAECAERAPWRMGELEARRAALALTEKPVRDLAS